MQEQAVVKPKREGLHVESPVIESLPLSQHLGVPVYLKMDSVQPSGSFKIRGIGIEDHHHNNDSTHTQTHSHHNRIRMSACSATGSHIVGAFAVLPP